MQTFARRFNRCAVMLTVALGVLANSAHGQIVRVRGSLALAQRTAITAIGNYAYTAGSNNFAIVNVSNPDAPSLAGQVAPSAPTINAISVAGNYAYCAAASTGLVTIRVTNPASPQWVSTLALSAVAGGVAARDTLVAVSTVSGVNLVGTRNPATPHILTSYNAVARWIIWGSSSTRLHVGTDDGVLLLEIHTTVSQGDTTLTLQRVTDYGSGRWSPTAVAAPYVDAAGTGVLVALRESDYGFAGQYSVPAAIRAIAGGTGFSFVGLANGNVQFLDQRTTTPSFVASVTLGNAPTGLALTQTGGQSLTLTTDAQGVTVLSYTPLAAPEREIVPVPSELSVRAYPNPFNAVVELEISAVHPGSYTLELFDALGRTAMTRMVHVQNSAVERLNLASFPSGIYWARVQNAHSSAVVKLLYLP